MSAELHTAPTMAAAIEWAFGDLDDPGDAALEERLAITGEDTQRAQDGYERQLFGGDGW